MNMSEESNIEYWDIGAIRPYEKNAKIHDDKHVEKIAKSISTFGWRGNPILVEESGEIIAGHGRRLAAIKLGMSKVPVVVARGLSEDEVKALRLADNRAAIGDYDSELLQSELAGLDMSLEGIFDKKELDFLVADLGEMKVEAFVADLDEEVAKQSAETVQKIAATDERDVRIDRALGFKAIKGRDERVVARFMAQIEAETGKAGAEAFVEFVSSVIA